MCESRQDDPGVTGLTMTLAEEWGRYNVTANTVAFGLIKTG